VRAAKKLSGQEGLSLVEMLCATLVLILLGLLLSSGIQLAANSYRELTAASETQLLLSTAIDAMADDLRFARQVNADSSHRLTTYFSDSYGRNSDFRVTGGQLMAGPATSPMRVLPPGAYGNGAYEITGLSVTYEAPCFVIQMTVASRAMPHITAATPEGGVTVRCLNAPRDTGKGGETP